MEGLSSRQEDVLRYISGVTAEKKRPPTYREIGDALGIASTNGVADHVKALVRKGYLAFGERGKARSFRVKSGMGRVTRRGAVVSVRLFGGTVDGLPDEATYSRTLLLDRTLLPPGDLFAVQHDARPSAPFDGVRYSEGSSEVCSPGDVLVFRRGGCRPTRLGLGRTPLFDGWWVVSGSAITDPESAAELVLVLRPNT